MLLAVDTATRVMSIALHDGNFLLAERTWHTNNRHTVELVPAIQDILAGGGVATDHLTALAASIGPGSYTGLRIGVAFAKGLAASHRLPLVGVSTLDILAAGQPYYQSGLGLIVVVQAGRGRIIVNSYRWRKGRWVSHTDARLMTWETLIETLDGPACITGEIDPKGLEIITKTPGGKFPLTIASPAYRLRRAGFLAQLAWEKLNAADDKSVYSATKLLPIYVKSETTV